MQGIQKTVCPVCLSSVNWARARVVPAKFVDRNLDEVDAGKRIYNAARQPARGERIVAPHYRLCIGGHRPSSSGPPRSIHLLPEVYAQAPPVFVALVGNSGASKSHFLAALRRSLSTQDPLSRSGCYVRATDAGMSVPLNDDPIEEVAIDFGALERQVFDRGRPIPRTRPDSSIGPFLFSVERNGEWVANIVFLDIAGETLNDARRSKEVAPYLVLVSGIIFLVDPKDIMSALSEECHQDILSGSQSKSASQDLLAGGAATLLDDSLQAIHRMFMSAGVNAKDVPASVVIGKSDLLTRQAEPTYYLRRDGITGRESLDLRSVRRESEAVLRVLESANRGAAATLSRFGPKSGHFVSATNGPLIETNGQERYQDPKPVGVVKPLASILAALGLIPVTADGV